MTSYTDAGETYTMEYLRDWKHAEYDPNKPNRVKKRNLAGYSAYFTYDPNTGLITQRKNADNAIYDFTFNPDGTLYEESIPDTPINRHYDRYTWNANGSVATIFRDATAPGNTTSVNYHYLYQDVNFPEKVTSIVPYDGYGAITRHYQEWRYEYFGLTDPAPGALKKVIRVLSDGTVDPNAVSEYTYNTNGQVLTTKDATGAITTYGYNPTTGDLTSVTYPKNSDSGPNPVYVYGRDSLGRVTSVTDPLGKITTYTYDNVGRITSVTLPKPAIGSPLNFVTTYTYDNYDGTNVYTTQTDPNTKITKQYFDQFGQMVKSEDAQNNITLFTYTKGLLSSIQDSNNNVTTYAYNAMRQLITTTFPDGLQETYTYWPNGLLWTKTDRKAQITSYFYDRAQKVLTKCYGALGSGYACTSPKVTYAYTGQKLTQVVNTLSTSQTHGYSYDNAYRVLTVSGPLANDNVTYGYDAANRVASYLLESGPNGGYTYYEDGSLKTQTWSAVTGQFLYTYTLNGQYDLITFPNGQTRDYTYDDQGRLTQLANVHPTAGNLASYAYGYDVDNTTGLATMLGQRSSLTATVPSQSFNNHQTLYYYDTNYQLNKTGYPNVAPFNNEIHEWTYDAIGNRLTNKINNTTQTYTYYKNGSNPLNGQRLQNDGTKTYTYDNNGNLVGDGTYTYTWNKDNQVTGISGGGQTISYKYDYMGKRISKTVSGVTTTYAYDGQNLIAELGATRIDYFFGPGIDEPLASKIGSNVYYYSVDGLGSDSLVSDANGTVQNQYVYDAWGIVRSQTAAVANSFGYTSREFAEVGLLYYRARYYNPNIGRFVSEDPIGDPWVSLFSYTLASPAMFTDPLGLYEIIDNIRVKDNKTIRMFRLNCNGAAGECADKQDLPRVLSAKCKCFCTPGGFATKYTVTLGGQFYVFAGPWAQLGTNPCVDKTVVDRDTAEAHARNTHINPAKTQLEYLLIELEFRRYSNYDECKHDCDAQANRIRGKFRGEINATIDLERSQCPQN